VQDPFRGRVLESPALVDELRLAVGAVHRLAWVGPDVHGDREHALSWLREAVGVLDASNPGLAAIVDWWQAVAVDRPAVQPAWSIDRVVGAPAGEALRRILEAGDGLQALSRPARFREALDALRQFADRNPGKIGGDKAIFAAANEECKRLLRAANDGLEPPTGLRLLEVDAAGVEIWAGEGGAGRRVEPGTPVWDHTIKQLAYRAAAAREVVRLWPRSEARAPLALPSGWEAPVRAAAGKAHEVAIALVQDALPDPPPRPVLETAHVREALRAGGGRDPAGSASAKLAFFLAREAWADAPDDRPPWLVRLATRADELARQIDARDYTGDALTWLREARAELSAHNLDSAGGALQEADQEHRRATQGADLDRRVQRSKKQAEQLAAIGRAPPVDAGDPVAWGLAVESAWSAARADVDRASVALTIEASLFAQLDTDALDVDLDAARAALGRADLPDAVLAIERARGRARELRRADDERLGPALSRLRDRTSGWAGPERAAIHAAMERCVARRAAGLPEEPDVSELELLVDALDARSPPAAVCIEEAGARPVRVAWVWGGVVASGDEARPYGARTRSLRIAGSAPSDAVSRVGQWGEVLVRPEDGSGPGPVFSRQGDVIVGPYAVNQGAASPQHEWLAVAALPEARFAELFGLVDLGRRRALVPRPPTLPELLSVGATPIDLLDEDALADWLARELEGAPPPQAVRGWLARHPPGQGLPDAIAGARASRLAQLLGTAERLAKHRADAVKAYLTSAAGKAEVARTAERIIERDMAEVKAQVEARRVDLEASLQRAKDELNQVREELRAEEEAAAVRRQALQDAETTAGVSEVHRAWANTPLRAGVFEPTEVPDLIRLVTDVAGATWDAADVANLVLSLATGRWTLLAGLPGVGKSTFVRSVLARLGHGPGTERYLELVVRRDWSDDAALFGFWHPTERAWTPSSEGFVEHLLRARDDERLGHGGLWPVLVEELNLASPEYYLARPISAFESPNAEVRLYDPGAEPVNGGRYPSSFPVPDSVRMVATVNVDDTVERLSPRFLSRASVIWVDSGGSAAWRPEDDAPRHRVRWAALRGLAERGEADLGRLGPVIEFLQQSRIPGAPTVRTQRAIARYLAASRGILGASDAEDLQILQRVLPPVRGTGPRWRGILDRLADLLSRGGWKRSAQRTRELREIGEESGDWYDFFHG
jgi:hypothetical protein